MVSWRHWQVVSLLVSQRLRDSAFASFCRRGNGLSCGEGLVQVGQVEPSVPSSTSWGAFHGTQSPLLEHRPTDRTQMPGTSDQ